ncbi:MAG: amidohydrolase family protein [Gemmatimonadetes bacterium]|nr:amidohydrolase family protein [Gemmatimonadota bacterium]
MISRIHGLSILLLAVLSTAAFAQERIVAIKARQIIDGTGRAPIANGVVLVRGDRIDAVGPAASVTIPAGAEVIDLGDETLLPGLIDTHGHLSLRFGITDQNGAVMTLAQGQAQPDGTQMLRMVRDARAALLCGVTTMRMVGEQHWNDIYLKRAVETGQVPGPRMILGGEPISSTSGHGSPQNWVDGPWDGVRAVRENFGQGVEWLKLLLIDRTPNATLFSPEELKAMVDEAHRVGMKVTAHATGRWGSAIRAAIEAGVDNIEHARPMTDDIIRLMVQRGTTVSLTPLVYVGFRPDATTWQYLDAVAKGPGDWVEYGRKQFFDFRKTHPEVESTDRPYVSEDFTRAGRDFFPSIATQQREALAAFQSGVPVSLGLDTVYYGTIGNAIEFLIEGGFAPMDAIRAATAVAAKNIGYGDRLGTLEKGKFADLISLRADPLTRRWAWNTIHFVMKSGQRYDTLSWN